tara:strand:- start:27999 stop:28712 length:714 start_codon:yes stop_codon:yes gene_type:complete
MMLVNREEQLALDFDALFADPPDYGAAIDEDEMSIDWALEEIRELFKEDVSPLAVPASFPKGKDGSRGPRPRQLVRSQTPITTLADVEWVEQLGAEVLQQVLYGYELKLLATPCNLRMATPCSDPSIQEVWDEMAELLVWTDEGLEKLCLSVLDYQIDLLEAAQTVHYGRDSRLSDEVRDIWDWMTEKGLFCRDHPLPFNDLAALAGCDGDILARGLWDRLPAFVNLEMLSAQAEAA